MSSLSAHYFKTTSAMLEKAVALNRPTLEKLGAVIGESVAKGGMLHLFGSGHSDIIARELVGRAGGLACIGAIPDATGGFVENLPGYGTKVAERYDRQHGLLPGETILVISNSGKNASPLEVALYARSKGLKVVGLTCVEMSKSAASSHPGGRNLHAIADYVLDNCGVPGDAIVDVHPNQAGLPAEASAKAGSTSTIISAMLLNLLSLEIVGWLQAGAHPLPILRSQNLPGGLEFNRELAKKYRGRLSRPPA